MTSTPGIWPRLADSVAGECTGREYHDLRMCMSQAQATAAADNTAAAVYEIACVAGEPLLPGDMRTLGQLIPNDVHYRGSVIAFAPPVASPLLRLA